MDLEYNQKKMYVPGTKVQAVDELGRWEEGTVVRYDSSNDSYTVSFNGWSNEFDRDVTSSEIRRPGNVFDQDIASSSTLKRCRKRLRESDYRELLRQLCADDTVTFMKDGQKKTALVSTVDRFRREVTVCLDGGSEQYTIHASFLLNDLLCRPAETTEPRKRQLKKDQPESDGDKRKEGSICINSDQHQQPRCDFYWALCSSGSPIYCGDVVEVSDMDVHLAVHTITDGMKDRKVVGHPVTQEGKINYDTCVSTQAHLIKGKTEIKVSREVSNKLKKIKNNSVVAYISCSKESFNARRNERVLCIKSLALKEMKSLLQGKAPKRLFSWGLCQLDIDPLLFNIGFPGTTRAVFSYSKGNLAKLDTVFGEKWDILVEGTTCSFVTQMVVWITKDNLLNASVQVSKMGLPSHLQRDYRKQLMDILPPSLNGRTFHVPGDDLSAGRD
ncbi:hypothetical protein HOLleu_03333 [Holothuria leucospilota]|uniref:Tudor domain-containing protein n=1 Tax=Holothuria leucospilota TaxID=206669 RepID=A0A9Q1HK71_HOLLE|nr:hypothetical protein HOLleu_03333 [Holothuria leucospilota]